MDAFRGSISSVLMELYRSESQFFAMYPVEVPLLTVTPLDIVHGDVKCENILIFEKDEGQPQIGNHSGLPTLLCRQNNN